ncbi:UPF0182 family protein [Corynebacterium sp. 153RC1]|uniref:UPF0182 family protein n=1 Tax=unclassified Corynebacterium TaxID=2624378 RepID=UPI00211CCFC7|nr:MULTISPECIES: UPF0182 family protein [unclassified Corynebacterium]MCQ9371218.1 UPF0182 family protein [Corynebacterium sp. 35RC1]MCQ9352084.1 UPF0182 family protein [Corynebacterium sp. 209RC1]MCQ9354086.1 UPF0182 family protein [Corynebacterium sp. 1222RC1]MCQ9356366.1 UPF0182 family protein [Corynebacterium sp. 122RC1]MCQ9358468.1 UPF0182 family protein [Corynebacterium sp. 142RC1]
MTQGLKPPSPAAKRPSRMWTTIFVVVGILIAVVPTAIGFYTDWLWFGEVGFRGVFQKVIFTRIALFVIFAAIAALVVWLAGWVAYRGRPSELEQFDLSGPMLEYRRVIEASVRRLLVVLPLFIGAIAGMFGQANWRVVQMFLNRQDFGVQDQQFGLDYGFYAFVLPMLRILVSTFSVLLVVAFLVALFGHYLLGGIRIGNQAAGIKGVVSQPARIQLAVTAGLWMLLRVASYFLDRYELLFNSHPTFTGGSYTDINAVLPAKIILMVIAAVVALSFFAAVVLKDLRIPALSTVLMMLSALVIGTAWPLMIERFSVQPNRAEKETEYIARNIEATRYAYGITDEQVTYIEDWGASGASNEAVANDTATVSNIRLLDPEIVSPTFTQQQQLRNFYGFPESLTVDRYEIDGEMRDFVVAARELNPNSLRENQRDWINRHTVYTHGNGIVAAQANQVDEVARDVGSARGGYPVYTVSDLYNTDTDARAIGLDVTEPRIYFGPLIASAADGADYAVVGTADGTAVEYDTDTSTYTYTGQGGVGIGNVFNRAAFALQYQELNLILSERVNENSKIIYQRDPRERVHNVAPWLTTDSTTYPAVVDGRIKWIVDGYTTLSALPYVSRTNLQEATQDTSAGVGAVDQLAVFDQVGYIRNSVKAVVDAYDGTVELYEFDENDPVLKAWEGVFPGTVKPKSEISEDLMNHLRYPEDMFKVQREMLARYHVDDAREFFTNDRFWSVPGDPSADEAQQNIAQPAYYVVAADPETGDPSFQLITPFRGLQREFLAAHMSVSSDPETFGRITVRVLPTNTLTQGPKQAQDTMMSSDQIASDRTLWGETNELFNGNLLTLPVGDGEILYVEPLYSQRKGQDSAFPKLLRVLVSYKGQVGYAPTISEALAQVGIDPRAAQDLAEADLDNTQTASAPRVNEGSTDAESTSTGAAPTTSAQAPASAPDSVGTEAEAVQAINDALRNLENARGGTNEEYGRALDELDRAVRAYQGLVNN